MTKTRYTRKLFSTIIPILLIPGLVLWPMPSKSTAVEPSTVIAAIGIAWEVYSKGKKVYETIKDIFEDEPSLSDQIKEATETIIKEMHDIYVGDLKGDVEGYATSFRDFEDFEGDAAALEEMMGDLKLKGDGIIADIEQIIVEGDSDADYLSAYELARAYNLILPMQAMTMEYAHFNQCAIERMINKGIEVNNELLGSCTPDFPYCPDVLMGKLFRAVAILEGKPSNGLRIENKTLNDDIYTTVEAANRELKSRYVGFCESENVLLENGLPVISLSASAQPLRLARLTINFTQIRVHDDADPSGDGKLWLDFNVGGQTGRWPSSGTKEVESGHTYPINKRFEVNLTEGESLAIYVKGTDEDEALQGDRHDDMGFVWKELVSVDEWGKGVHFGRHGRYTIGYTIDVTQRTEQISPPYPQWFRYKIYVPSDASDLEIRMSGGSGDADLYARFGSNPTLSSFDCRPYTAGNSETCRFSIPRKGYYYIGVQAYREFSDVTLEARFLGGELKNGRPVSGLYGSQSEWVRYRMYIGYDNKHVDKFVVQMFGGPGDADLYVSRGFYKPTESEYDCRPYTGGCNEDCTFDPLWDTYYPTNRLYYIYIRAYRDYSDVTLRADLIAK